jgi:hypothetical protein
LTNEDAYDFNEVVLNKLGIVGSAIYLTPLDLLSKNFHERRR